MGQMLGLAALFLLAMQEITAPRTVNGIILGPIEDYTVAGPARLCLGHLWFDLSEGETAYVQYLGIHNASLIIEDRERRYELRLGSLADNPVAPEDVVRLDREDMVSQRGEGPRAQFVYHVWEPFYSEFSPRILIDDDQVRRAGIAGEIFDRMGYDSETPPRECDRTFEYGWNFILGTPSEE